MVANLVIGFARADIPLNGQLNTLPLLKGASIRWRFLGLVSPMKAFPQGK